MRAPEVCALLKPPKTYLNLDEEIIEEFANNLIRVLVQKKEPEKAPESPKFIFERSNPFFVFEIKSVRKSPIGRVSKILYEARRTQIRTMGKSPQSKKRGAKHQAYSKLKGTIKVNSEGKFQTYTGLYYEGLKEFLEEVINYYNK